ncbi:hypothetical protein FB451DRAFT_1218085 [Mycena latifolia]|nr:hypothetical protein FB451DRAFT_1218085 [Mycena latifolia]
MNRPRPSVLQLFDPLSTRDAHSPESDKENTLPDYDFFPSVKHPSPVRLTRRLVEVGDVTVDFQVPADNVDQEGAAGGEEDGTVGFRRPPSPRTPLGDVTFDRERTPMRSKMYRRKPAASEVIVSPSSAPSDDHASASPINVVNASGGSSHARVPSVVICSPDKNPSSSNGDTDTLSTSLATLSLATPTGSLIADTTLAFPTPSEASTSLVVPIARPPSSTASFNPDRSSADLHSSFALHMDMNPAESSFDLLNDQISFLSHGDEESYYVEGVLGPALEQEDASQSGVTSPAFTIESNTHNGLSLVTVPSGSSSRSGSPPLLVLEIPQATLNTVEQHPPASPAILLEPSIIPPVAPVFVAPPATIHALSTSLPEPPTLVPALKIVKRKRPDAATGSEIGTPGLAEGVQSGDPPVPAHSRAARITSLTAPSAGRHVTEGQGPWRVPISNSDKEKVATTARYHKPIPGTTLSGPRRVPLPTQPPPPTKAPSQTAQTTNELGLKRPLRLVPPNGSASSLPRAVVGGTSNPSGSRLPMPKTNIATGGTGTRLPRRRIV